MPAGERSQVWYPQLVALLRNQWRADLSWDGIISLRERVQHELEALRSARGIKPPMMRCPRCGVTGPQASPRISVRAMLLALARFEIEPEDLIRRRERSWARHRAGRGLDLFGRVAGGEGRCDGH
jgi:hypothetical protein